MFSEYRILIFSENPDELMKFYRDILGMKLEKSYTLPNDYGYMFLATPVLRLWIAKHSKVHGKNQDSFRHIFNLYVDSVDKWYNKIKNHPQVQIICTPEKTPLYTEEKPFYVSTFLDPEGNCWQFMGKK